MLTPRANVHGAYCQRDNAKSVNDEFGLTIRRAQGCVKTPRHFSEKMRATKEDEWGTPDERTEGRKAAHPRPKIKRPRVRLQLHVLRSESHRPFPPRTSAKRLRRYSNKGRESETNSVVHSMRRSLLVSSSERHRALMSWENREEKLPNSCRDFCRSVSFLSLCYNIYIYI